MPRARSSLHHDLDASWIVQICDGGEELVVRCSCGEGLDKVLDRRNRLFVGRKPLDIARYNYGAIMEKVAGYHETPSRRRDLIP